jgi:PAS domain S-box-containing protein
MAVTMWLIAHERGASGKLLWWLGAAFVMEVIALVTIVVMLWRRLAMQNESLQQINRHLEEAQRVARLGYWEIGSRGDVYWSDEMYEIAGLPRDSATPTETYLQRVHAEDRPRLQEVARAAVEEHRPFSQQYRLVVPGQPVRTVQAHGYVVRDSAGRERLVGTVQDITERATLEEQLRQAQKMEAVGRLAGGIAHDFNNLLTVINAHCEFALGGPDIPQQTREDLQEVRAAGTKAAALTRQLLAFSRRQPMELRDVDLNEAVSGIEKMLRRVIGEDVEVITRLVPDLWLVRTDRGQMEQVIMNLAINARDAMPGHGRLTIETANVQLDGADPDAKAIGDYVMLTVTDTGSGIPRDVLDKIFDPFFTTKEIGKGTGLGLATVLGIVEQSGGHIRVYSEIGHGTSFKVFMPRRDVRRQSGGAVEHRQARHGAQQRILLVEDDDGVRQATARILKRANYQVAEEKSPDRALSRFANGEQFDLLMTDMVMPGIGGLELIARTREYQPGICVLLMSGFSRESITSRQTLPDVGFIEKPFNAAALTAKIHEILEGGSGPLVIG